MGAPWKLLGTPWGLLGRSLELHGSSLDLLRSSSGAPGGSWKALGCSWEALGSSLEAPGSSLGARGCSSGPDMKKKQKARAEKPRNSLRTKAQTHFRQTRQPRSPTVIGDFGGAPGRQFATVASTAFGAREATRGGTPQGAGPLGPPGPLRLYMYIYICITNHN